MVYFDGYRRPSMVCEEGGGSVVKTGGPSWFKIGLKLFDSAII